MNLHKYASGAAGVGVASVLMAGSATASAIGTNVARPTLAFVTLSKELTQVAQVPGQILDVNATNILYELTTLDTVTQQPVTQFAVKNWHTGVVTVDPFRADHLVYAYFSPQGSVVALGKGPTPDAWLCATWDGANLPSKALKPPCPDPRPVGTSVVSHQEKDGYTAYVGPDPKGQNQVWLRRTGTGRAIQVSSLPPLRPSSSPAWWVQLVTLGGGQITYETELPPEGNIAFYLGGQETHPILLATELAVYPQPCMDWAYRRSTDRGRGSAFSQGGRWLITTECAGAGTLYEYRSR